MIETLYIQRGSMPARALREAERSMETALSRLANIRASSGEVSAIAPNFSSFGEVEESAQAMERMLRVYYQRLGEYMTIFQQAPSLIADTDAAFRSSLTTWHERAAYDIQNGLAQSPIGGLFDICGLFLGQELAPGFFTSLVVDFAGNVASGFKTGVAAVVDVVQDSVAFWVEDYQSKGLTYKVIQSVSAVVKIAASVTACTAMWSSVLGTGGGSVPVAALSTIYTANSINSSLSDLKNLWGGDIDQVGEVDLLEEFLTFSGGEIGEMLGNRELGETVGNGVYALGSITITLNELSVLSDKITQAPNFAPWSDLSGEIKTGAQGIWDIATNSPISANWTGIVPTLDFSAVQYDMKLLSYTVPNLMETGETVSLGIDVIKNYAKGLKAEDKFLSRLFAQ